MILKKDEVMNWKERKMFISTRVSKKEEKENWKEEDMNAKGTKNGLTEKNTQETFKSVNRGGRRKNEENEYVWGET